MQLGTRCYLITLNYVGTRIVWTVIERLSAERAYIHFWAKFQILIQFERKWKSHFSFMQLTKTKTSFLCGLISPLKCFNFYHCKFNRKNVHRPFHPSALQLHSLPPTEAMLVTHTRTFAPHYLSARSLVFVKLVNINLELKVTISLLLLLKSASIAENIWHFSTKEARMDSQEPTSLGYK